MKKWSIELINQLQWRRLEELCTSYFEAKGRKSKIKPLGPDGGVDIKLFDHKEPNKISGIVQCKAWSPKRIIKVGKIRELYGVMSENNCRFGVFITTAQYSNSAKRFAKGKHIILLDSKKLLKQIENLPKQQQQNLLTKATKGNFDTPTCIKCGKEMTKRKGPKSTFWGCKGFPECRNKMYIRK